MKKLAAWLLCICLLLSGTPSAFAYEEGQSYRADLSELIKNEENRRYVEMMLDHYLRTDDSVQKALRDGYSAMFLFEGCSDNMDHPDLMDLTYYRVSAVCILIRLNKAGQPYISYFSEDCSTLPDRPLEYGAWYLDQAGRVGPATVCDGTYALYSVRHAGAYEALHIRTSFADSTLCAVYMTPQGYVTARADSINIHTRNVNHVIQGAMWSAGCVLVGDGDFSQFTELMDAAYYGIYERFTVGARVGTVTINRQQLKEEMYTLYESKDAVDMLLAASRHQQPEAYLNQCEEIRQLSEAMPMKAVRDTRIMTLPCSNETDARSVLLEDADKRDILQVTGSIRNSMGNIWYIVELGEKTGYVYSEDMKESGWLPLFFGEIF